MKSSLLFKAARSVWPYPGRLLTLTKSRTYVRLLATQPYNAPCRGGSFRFYFVNAAPGLSQTRRSLSEDVVKHIQSCPGCGALAQNIESGEAGYYNPKRRAVRLFLEASSREKSGRVPDQVLESHSASIVNRQVSNSRESEQVTILQPQDEISPLMPLCDRCHDLLHHRSGVPIHHPSIEAIQDTIAESPYKHNHIYHIIDAADFPLSLIPNIHKELSASLQRSKNRRAKHAGYRYGRKTEISFVITRSDLLAPRKEQVDRLMAYLISVLRSALGPYASDVRLGNVRCVSARRNWWTRDLKADIWDRGGGGWMVGKVNVGKSNLFEMVFPKGRAEDINVQALRSQSRSLYPDHKNLGDLRDEPRPAQLLERNLVEDENSLLPPARKEIQYPRMPTVSALPGTTASPIRIPFGNGKGELVDLPGLERSSIETYVLPEHRESLIMKVRIVPEQYSLKFGRSLLLGDLIRITPVDPDIVILAYPFVPLVPHLTSTAKATDIQAGIHSEKTGLSLIMTEQGQQNMRCAGRFKLRWDVTKQRSGPLTSKDGVALRPQSLAFTVLSTDILIEGIGWVELVAQVRRTRPLSRSNDRQEKLENPDQTLNELEDYPEVDVFSPDGKYIDHRQPMGAWLLNARETNPTQKNTGGRPRRSMATAKRARTPAS